MRRALRQAAAGSGGGSICGERLRKGKDEISCGKRDTGCEIFTSSEQIKTLLSVEQS